MIPDVDVVSVQSNFTGQTHRVGIDPEAMAHIMDSLSGLYSNIHRAILRELSTNARDSQIAAGVNRPIEVQLPNRLNNELIIRDYGLGLNVDDIFQMFTYGSSTKRESNDFNGIMGFGSKSPWAYTHTFSLTAVKDGVRTMALLTKDAEGIGQVQILDTGFTNESNGVEITIPVKPGDEWQFEREATDLFTYWPQDAVLINNRPPREFDYKIKLTDSIYLREESGGNDIVVMGGVPYMVRGENKLFQRNTHYRTYSVVVFANNGDIRFAPSREGIKYNHAATLEKLEFWHNEVNRLLADKVNDEIAQCQTHNEAARMASDYSNLGINLTYKGLAIPRSVTCHHVSVNSGTEYDVSFSLAYVIDGVVIKGFSGKKVSKQQRQKIANHTGATRARLVLNDDNAIWLDHIPQFEWNDVVKEKVAPAVKRGFTWGVLTQSGVHETPDLKDNVVFVEVDDKPRSDQLRYWTNADCDIVVLRKRYADQFKTLYPNAKSLKQYALGERQKYEIEAQSSFTYEYNDYVLLKKLDANAIDDPHLKDHIIQAQALAEPPNYYNNRVKMPQWVIDIAGSSYNLNKKTMYPFGAYPLLKGVDSNLDDVVLYVNTKYATLTNNKEN